MDKMQREMELAGREGRLYKRLPIPTPDYLVDMVIVLVGKGDDAVLEPDGWVGDILSGAGDVEWKPQELSSTYYLKSA